MFDLCSVCPFTCLALKKNPKYFELQVCSQYHVFGAVMKIMWWKLSLFFVSCFGSVTLASKHLLKYGFFKNYSFFLCCLSAFSISWEVQSIFDLAVCMHLCTSTQCSLITLKQKTTDEWVSKKRSVIWHCRFCITRHCPSFAHFIFTVALLGSHTHQKLQQTRNLLCRIHYIWGREGSLFPLHTSLITPLNGFSK